MLFLFIIAVFFALVILGVPIVWALAATVITYITASPNDYFIESVFLTFIQGMEPFTLLAIPLFIIAGELMAIGGISRRIVDFASNLLSFLPGGLGVVTVSSSMLFAGVSGSATADTAAVGSVMIPGMVRKGYSKEFSAALLAVSGTIGNIIPPSIPMIIYAFVANTSVRDLFLAGFIPGLLFGLGLIIWCMYVGRARGYERGGGGISFRAVGISFVKCLPALFMPIIVLFGIFTGIFTATEASAVAVFYALVVGFFVYKELTLADLPKIFVNSLVTSATVMVIIGATTALSWVLTYETVPMQIVEAISSLSLSRIEFLLLTNVVLLVLGMILEPIPILILTGPLLFPVAQAMNIDLIHLGIIMICNISIGLFTPPVGPTMFVAARIGDANVIGTVRNLVPMFFICTFVLLIVTLLPDFVLAPIYWLR